MINFKHVKNYLLFGGSAFLVCLSACTSISKENSESGSFSLHSASLFAELPAECSTPDAFDIAPDGSLTLSCVNYAGNKPGILLRLSEQGEVSTIARVPGLGGTGSARPMGIAYAPDGSLYVADNQGRNKGRLLRLTFKDNQLDKTEIVASGMSSPNGVRYYKGAVYLTQLQLPKVGGKNISSAVYRFDETDRNVAVASDGTSDKLIFSTQTENQSRQFGLDGLAFDQQGYLYVGNLGDGIIYRLTLQDNGKSVAKQEVYARLPITAGPDGINIDAQGNLYVAGFLSNEIYKIDTKRKVTLLAQYPDNNGVNGEIDQPADLIVYQGKLIISNFDLLTGEGIVNTESGGPDNISYIELE